MKQSSVWVLCALPCWLLAAGATLFDYKHNIVIDKHLQGASGQVCTNQGTKCISSATCVEKICVCHAGTQGDGTVDCVATNEHLCTVTNDFEVRGFGPSDSVTVVFPCPVRLASFKVKSATPLPLPLPTPRPPASSSGSKKEVHVQCHVEVLGVPSPDGGRNKIRGFLVRLGLAVPGEAFRNQFFTVGGSAAGFSLNEVTWSAESGKSEAGHWTGWGKGFQLVSLGVNITGYLDLQNNFLILDIVQCRTTVKLRVPDQFDRQQVPALTIKAPPVDTWESAAKPEVAADRGMCGMPGDSPFYWRLQAKARSVPLKRSAALSVALSGRPAGHVPGTYSSCSAPPRTFHLCPQEQHDLAIKRCAPLLTERHLTVCLLNSGHSKNDYLQLLLTFDSCLSFVCFRHDSAGCLEVKTPKCFKAARRYVSELVNTCEK